MALLNLGDKSESPSAAKLIVQWKIRMINMSCKKIEIKTLHAKLAWDGLLDVHMIGQYQGVVKIFVLQVFSSTKTFNRQQNKIVFL